MPLYIVVSFSFYLLVLFLFHLEVTLLRWIDTLVSSPPFIGRGRTLVPSGWGPVLMEW